MSERGRRPWRVGIFLDRPDLHYKHRGRGVKLGHLPDFHGRPAEIRKFLGEDSWRQAVADDPLDAVFFTCHGSAEPAYLLLDALPRRPDAPVCFTLADGDESDLEAVERLSASLLPPRRPDRHLGRVTRDALTRQVLEGRRVVCRNLVSGSRHVMAAKSPAALEPLAAVFRDLHARAAAGEQPLCAVIGLQRTGSTFLADFVSLSAPFTASVFHEHAIPKYRSDRLSQEPLEPRERYLEQVKDLLALRFAQAPHRFLFVTEREPAERLLSLFAKARRRQLLAAFRPAAGDFENREALLKEFFAFADHRVTKMRKWYESHWPRAVGFRLSEMPPPGERGYSVDRRDGTTAVVIRTQALDRLVRQGLQRSFGVSNYPLFARNSADDLGYSEMYQALRRLARFPAELEARVRAIPEVARLHGEELPERQAISA